MNQITYTVFIPYKIEISTQKIEHFFDENGNVKIIDKVDELTTFFEKNIQDFLKYKMGEEISKTLIFKDINTANSNVKIVPNDGFYAAKNNDNSYSVYRKTYGLMKYYFEKVFNYTFESKVMTKLIPPTINEIIDKNKEHFTKIKNIKDSLINFDKICLKKIVIQPKPKNNKYSGLLDFDRSKLRKTSDLIPKSKSLSNINKNDDISQTIDKFRQKIKKLNESEEIEKDTNKECEKECDEKECDKKECDYKECDYKDCDKNCEKECEKECDKEYEKDCDKKDCDKKDCDKNCEKECEKECDKEYEKECDKKECDKECDKECVEQTIKNISQETSKIVNESAKKSKQDIDMIFKKIEKILNKTTYDV